MAFGNKSKPSKEANGDDTLESSSTSSETSAATGATTTDLTQQSEPFDAGGVTSASAAVDITTGFTNPVVAAAPTDEVSTEADDIDRAFYKMRDKLVREIWEKRGQLERLESRKAEISRDLGVMEGKLKKLTDVIGHGPAPIAGTPIPTSAPASASATAQGGAPSDLTSAPSQPAPPPALQPGEVIRQ